MLFTADCSQLVVCNEGQPFESDSGEMIDPEGSIAVVELEDSSVEIIDFTNFNQEYVYIIRAYQ